MSTQPKQSADGSLSESEKKGKNEVSKSGKNGNKKNEWEKFRTDTRDLFGSQLDSLMQSITGKKSAETNGGPERTDTPERSDDPLPSTPEDTPDTNEKSSYIALDIIQDAQTIQQLKKQETGQPPSFIKKILFSIKQFLSSFIKMKGMKGEELDMIGRDGLRQKMTESALKNGVRILYGRNDKNAFRDIERGYNRFDGTVDAYVASLIDPYAHSLNLPKGKVYETTLSGLLKGERPVEGETETLSLGEKKRLSFPGGDQFNLKVTSNTIAAWKVGPDGKEVSGGGVKLKAQVQVPLMGKSNIDLTVDSVLLDDPGEGKDKTMGLNISGEAYGMKKSQEVNLNEKEFHTLLNIVSSASTNTVAELRNALKPYLEQDAGGGIKILMDFESVDAA